MKEPRTDTDALPLAASGVTLIRLRGREVLFDATMGGKRDLVATRKPKDRFLAAWAGQWRTDIFDVPPEMLATL